MICTCQQATKRTISGMSLFPRCQRLRGVARCQSTVPEPQQVKSDFSDCYKKIRISVLTKDRHGRFYMEVNVWDSLSESNKGRQTIVAVHGAPGGSADFKGLAERLTKLNYRVVIPDFPGFGGSALDAKDIYKLDNSTDGRADTLDEILQALDIRRVDVLLSHSAGSWVGYKLCAEDERVKSGVFISPLGARPHKALRPYNVIQFLNAKLQNPLFHDKIAQFLPAMYKMTGFNTQNLKNSELLAAIDTVSTCRLEKVYGYSHKIFQRRLPILMASSLSDKIVEKQIGEELVSYLGGNLAEHGHFYDSNTQLDREVFSLEAYYDVREKYGLKGLERPAERKAGGIVSSFFRFLLFEKGGHALQHTQCDMITTHLLDLLKHLKDKRL